MFEFDALHFIVLTLLWTVGTFCAGSVWGQTTAESDNNKKID